MRSVLRRALVAVVGVACLLPTAAFGAEPDDEPAPVPAPATPPPEPEPLEPLPSSPAPPPAPAPPPSDEAPPRVTPKPVELAPSPKNAISVQVLSLLGLALALQYERFLGVRRERAERPRLSLAGSAGYRGSGGTDFDVYEGTLGAEARYWLLGRDGFSKFDGPAMVGPYVGFRFDAGLTHVSDGSRVLGKTIRFAESIQLGARVTVASRVEITPAFGIGMRHEIDPDGVLSAWTRLEILRFGLTAGVLF